jgi:uncharacterized membrane protein YfcA
MCDTDARLDAGCGLGGGIVIGCVAYGGVLMTPALVYVGGLGFHLAAATSMWAFLFAGAVGTSDLR